MDGKPIERVGDRKTILASLLMMVDLSTGNDLSDIIKGKYPESVSPGEIGCVTSHPQGTETFCRRKQMNHMPSSWKMIVT